jgi:hypothetical protein
MATRTWSGATADGNKDADWAPTTPGVPEPGDIAVITAGIVVLTTATGSNQLFENNQVRFGGAAGATLLLRNRFRQGSRHGPCSISPGMGIGPRREGLARWNALGATRRLFRNGASAPLSVLAARILSVMTYLLVRGILLLLTTGG